MAKREHIQANKDWLESKAKEDGVKALPKGIYYKVLSEGNQNSAKPTVRSIITAHYTGRTIDGKQFDSSRGGVPLACRLCDLIEGWIIAMQQMHIGDKWMKGSYTSTALWQVTRWMLSASVTKLPSVSSSRMMFSRRSTQPSSAA